LQSEYWYYIISVPHHLVQKASKFCLTTWIMWFGSVLSKIQFKNPCSYTFCRDEYMLPNIPTVIQHVLPAQQAYRIIFCRDVSNLDHKFYHSFCIVAQSTPFNACKFVCSLFLSKYQKIKIWWCNSKCMLRHFEMSKKSFLHYSVADSNWDDT